jgi:non-specific serine/threonine protein kinase
MMDWSFDLLPKKERVLLSRLSVFAGGWVLEAAEAVCSGSGIEASEVLDLLTRLVDKSLIVAATQGDHARYHLLETVRQYTSDRLQEMDDSTRVGKRHREWYLRLGETVGPQARLTAFLVFGPHRAEVESLEFEQDNFRAALVWSKANEVDAEVELRLASALSGFWYITGHWDEGRSWLEDSLARNPDSRSSALLRALDGATLFARHQGDNARAVPLAERGLALSEELGDEESSIEFLRHLYLISLRQGHYRRASDLANEGSQRARHLGNKPLLVRVLDNVGFGAVIAGEYDRAAVLFDECGAIAKEQGFRPTAMLYGHGLIALGLHDHKRASVLFRECLVLARPVGKWSYQFVEQCLEGLAAAASETGDFTRGARLFAVADVLCQVLGRVRMAPLQTEHDQQVAATRSALGDAAFSAAWEEVHAMTLDEAIDYALTSP